VNNQVIVQPKPLEYYLNLRYPITLYPEAEGGYVAKIIDLPGCMTQGETLEEIMANINEARELWIETVYEGGRKIPLPSSEDTEVFSDTVQQGVAHS
jgi:antitoxin HicB